MVSEKRNSYGNIRISDWFNRPAILEQGNAFDELTRGLGTQPQLAADVYHDREVITLQLVLRKGFDNCVSDHGELVEATWTSCRSGFKGYLHPEKPRPRFGFLQRLQTFLWIT